MDVHDLVGPDHVGKIFFNTTIYEYILKLSSETLFMKYQRYYHIYSVFFNHIEQSLCQLIDYAEFQNCNWNRMSNYSTIILVNVGIILSEFHVDHKRTCYNNILAVVHAINYYNSLN